MTKRKIWPWIRALLALLSGLAAILLVHLLGQQVAPSLYESTPSTDLERAADLFMMILAGTVGSFVVGVIASERLRLHLASFLAVMLLIDIAAVVGYLSTQPLWYRALVLLTLPLQVWLGALLAGKIFRPRSVLGSAS